MQAVFNALIAHLNSSVFVLLGILFVSFVAIFKIGRLLGRWQEKFFNYENKMKDVEVKYDKKIDKVESKIESVNDAVIELKTKVQLIYDNTNPRRTYAPGSPIGLTDFGKQIAEKIKAEEMFKCYSALLVDKVNAACPQKTNAYDIQVESMNIAKKDLLNMVTTDEINLIKQTAFDASILVEDVMGILGVYLRDHILSLRGIPVLDVDKHDPDKK